MEKGKEPIIKIILIGESSVGKTSLIQAYLGRQFMDYTSNTINSESFNKTIKINNTTFNIHLWDTAGQERFRSLNKIFIKGSQIVIVVYDITKKKTFDEVPFWVDYAKSLLGDHIVLGLIGNKLDLFDKIENKDCGNNNDDGFIDNETGKKYADEIGAIFGETSAKLNAKGFQKYVNDLINVFFDKRRVAEVEWEVLSIDNLKKKEKHKSFCHKNK